MIDDLKAARARLELYANHKRVDHSKADIRTILTALDQATEALKPFAGVGSIGGLGLNSPQVRQKYPLFAHALERAATVYATLKPADTKEGEGS
jgi:hypothetical protein